MKLKNLSIYIQLIIIGFVVSLFLPIFDVIDVKYIKGFQALLIIAMAAILIFRKPKIKSDIEKFYEAVIANTAANEKGTFGDPDTNLRLKSLKMIDKDEDKERTKFTFKMGTGNSRSQSKNIKRG